MARVMIALVALALLAVSQGPIAGEARAASYTERTQALLGNLPTGVTIATAVERRIFTRLNQLRSGKRLPQLTAHQGLADAARVNSLRMQRDRFFAHDDPDGRGASDRVAAMERQAVFSQIGENLAQISPIIRGVADDMHDGWVKSPGHYRNMIKPDYDHVGVGCVQDGRKTICTQVFALVAGRFLTPVPVKIHRSSPPNVVAQFPKLDFGGWLLTDRQGKEHTRGTGDTLDAPRSLRGEFLLRPIGVKREERRIIYHHFFGPSVVLK